MTPGWTVALAAGAHPVVTAVRRTAALAGAADRPPTRARTASGTSRSRARTRRTPRGDGSSFLPGTGHSRLAPSTVGAPVPRARPTDIEQGRPGPPRPGSPREPAAPAHPRAVHRTPARPATTAPPTRAGS